MSIDNEFDVNKELKEYSTKNLQHLEGDINRNDNDMLGVMANFYKAQRKQMLSNLSAQQQMEKIQKDNEDLYKEKIDILEKENLEYRNIIKEYEKEERNFIKKTMDIIDEINKLKYYIDNNGSDKLKNTLSKNMKYIKKQLLDMNIEVIDCVGEIFNENYHNCVEVVEDLEKNNFEVVEEIKAGFKYKGHVVRAANVVVVENGGKR